MHRQYWLVIDWGLFRVKEVLPLQTKQIGTPESRRFRYESFFDLLGIRWFHLYIVPNAYTLNVPNLQFDV